MPQLTYKIIFIVIDLLILLGLYVIYKNTDLKLSDIRIKKSQDYTHYTDHSTIYSFIGLFIIVISSVVSHTYSLLYPDVDAYLFVGFKNYPSIFGVTLVFFGIGLFNWRFNEQTQFIESKNFIFFSLLIFPLTLFFEIILQIVGFLNINVASIVYELIWLWVGLILVVQIIAIRYGNFNSNVIKLRMTVSMAIYFVFLLLSTFNFYFLPFDPDPAKWLTRNPTIELVIMSVNSFAIIEAYLIYLLLKPDAWLRSTFNISDEEYAEYLKSSYLHGKEEK